MEDPQHIDGEGGRRGGVAGGCGSSAAATAAMKDCRSVLLFAQHCPTAD